MERVRPTSCGGTPVTCSDLTEAQHHNESTRCREGITAAGLEVAAGTNGGTFIGGSQKVRAGLKSPGVEPFIAGKTHREDCIAEDENGRTIGRVYRHHSGGWFYAFQARGPDINWPSH